MATELKKRIKQFEGKLLAFIISGIFFLMIIAYALSGINAKIMEYTALRDKSENRKNSAVHAELANTESEHLSSQAKVTETEEKYLTQRERLQKEAGIPAEQTINWKLVEAIAALVEHEVGFTERNFPGYDFNYLQQLMTKSVKNRLRSSDFPDDLYRVVTQEGQYPGVWEYICTHHHSVRDITQVNVLKALYNCDYDIPSDIYFEHSFCLNTSLTEATDIGEETPAVGSLEQAVEWLYQQPISTELYAYDSFIYVQSDGVQRLVIFSGSPSGPY